MRSSAPSQVGERCGNVTVVGSDPGVASSLIAGARGLVGICQVLRARLTASLPASGAIAFGRRDKSASDGAGACLPLVPSARCKAMRWRKRASA